MENNFKVELEALRKIGEQTEGGNQAITKETLQQHVESVEGKEGVKDTGNPNTTVKTMTGNEVADRAKTFPTMDEFRQQDQKYKAEFEQFIEQTGIYNSAKVIEQVEDPHVADLLHSTLLKKINTHI